MSSPPPPGPDRYGVGPAVVEVDCDDPALRASVGEALHDLSVPAAPSDAVGYRVHRVGPSWAPAPWSVSRGGRVVHAGLSAAEVVTFLAGEVAALLVARCPTQVPLRAGAVERDGRAVLLLGRSQDESSRLALALAAAGWGLLGDALVLLDLAGPALTPFWCPVEAPRAGAPGDPARTRDATALVPASAVASLSPACALGGVVLPAPAAADLDPPSSTETLAALVEHLAVAGPRGRAHVARLAQAVPSLPAAWADPTDLESTEAALAQLLGVGP